MYTWQQTGDLGSRKFVENVQTAQKRAEEAVSKGF
jgi:hypothetical protein